MFRQAGHRLIRKEHLALGNMNRVVYIAIVAATISVVCSADPVSPENCKGLNIPLDELRERVSIEPTCGKTRCKLRKGTNATISLRFRPTEELKSLTLDVYGIVGELSLPFVGVTGTSACKQVTKVDSGEVADCPLAPDVEYFYTKTFPIEPFYPNLNVKIHWSLVGDKGDVICFEVPATIK